MYYVLGCSYVNGLGVDEADGIDLLVHRLAFTHCTQEQIECDAGGLLLQCVLDGQD